MADENRDLPSLEDLESKIRKLKPEGSSAEQPEGNSDLAMAFRFTIDLLAGVLVGALIGYGIDALFKTLPWATIVCIFLGTGAGIRNMMRSARQIEEKNSE